MLSKVKKYNMLLRVVAMLLVHTLLLSNLAWANPDIAKTTLSAYTNLTEKEFREKFKTRAFLLAHDAANEYIGSQIEKEKSILKKEWESKKTEERGDPVLGSVKIVKVTGLLKHTGQFAHVGLSGKHYGGVPVIYIDSSLRKSDREKIIEHEIDEIRQWETLRDSLGLKRDGMRSWITKNNELAKKKAEE